MKKIYLLLSILLCFGFALSSEVQAQGDGPKIEDLNAPYLTFQSTSNFTLNVYDKTKPWDGTLYYSTDTTTWNVWDGTTTLNSVNNKLYLRGKGNTVITGNDQKYRWVLTGSNIECTGNIENLLDWETVASGNHPPMASYCYSYMFQECKALASAPALPATTLTERCYSHMFRGCTALASVPALPATILAPYCYISMFRDCTALTSVPALPATTLANYCYNGMFRDCTSLKISSTQTGAYLYEWRIPTSGTGTLASGWNAYMFSGTGGTFIDDPSINTTYYVENPPVEDLNPSSGFNITFEENGGSTISDIEEATKLPNPLPIPTKENYTFLGWYYDSDFTNEAFADDPLTTDVTLYAKWGKKNKMTDITILIIGLIIFIIANILGFIYKNNLLTALSGLLWLLPIFLVDNAIIKIFSIIIMLITFLFNFKERDDYYYD